MWNSKLLRFFPLPLFAGSALLLIVTSYAAYKGHADDSDVDALLSAYPALKGSAIDSCAACHRSGEVPDAARPGKMRRENHCDYCHVLHVNLKHEARETLNSYGADYLAAGRGVKAVKALASNDSDRDGFSNEAEFLKGTNPGSRESNPSARVSESRIYTVEEMRKMSPVVSETVFVNTTKSRSGDSYNEYRGTKVYDWLQAIGIAATAESVDFISLDGYERTQTLDELKKAWPQGAPVMGLGKETIGACAWVNYSVPGLDANKPIPPAVILLAFEENGRPLQAARFEADTGRLSGAGPLRLIVPQFDLSPPDLGQRADASCADKIAEQYRFHENYDHNGGKCSSAVVAIRVNPLPKGTRDFEWETMRNKLMAEGKLVVFGALKPQRAKAGSND
jgi:hypothetical protein